MKFTHNPAMLPIAMPRYGLSEKYKDMNVRRKNVIKLTIPPPIIEIKYKKNSLQQLTKHLLLKVIILLKI